MATPRTFLIFVLTAVVSAGAISDGQEVENSDGLKGNQITLTQMIGSDGSGCCKNINQILTLIKDIKQDIALILEANSTAIVEGGDEPGTTEEPTTTKAPTTTEEPTTTETPTTTEVGCPDQWVENKGNCYLLVEEYKDAADARTDCQATQKDAFLASIENQNENDFIYNLISGKDLIFIGLQGSSSSGIWNWDDGTPFSYSNWRTVKPVQPNDGKEACVIMNNKNGLWSDTDCIFRNYYICKFKIGSA